MAIDQMKELKCSSWYQLHKIFAIRFIESEFVVLRRPNSIDEWVVEEKKHQVCLNARVRAKLSRNANPPTTKVSQSYAYACKPGDGGTIYTYNNHIVMNMFLYIHLCVIFKKFLEVSKCEWFLVKKICKITLLGADPLFYFACCVVRLILRCL